MEILYDRYQRITFVLFTINLLIDILGWSLSDEDSLQNPAKGVTEVQQILSHWSNNEIEKDLTTDNLFTALYCLSKDYHQRLLTKHINSLGIILKRQATQIYLC